VIISKLVNYILFKGSISHILSDNTIQTNIIYYSGVLVSALKKPILGLTDLQLDTSANYFSLFVTTTNYWTNALRYTITITLITDLKAIKMRYLAIDNIFAFPFSLNYLTFVKYILIIEFFTKWSC
jgi:hypothetical protein